MAVPVARVLLKVAHAALPALLPTPPKWKMLPTPTTTPPPCLTSVSVLRKPPPAKPGRADTDERWDAHKPGRADAVDRWDARKKKAGSPASSSPSSSLSSSVSSAERWDVHKKRRLQQAEALDDGESSTSTGSNDDDDVNMDTEEEEVILWKPRAMYAGPGFVVPAPKSSMLPMPTSFLVTA